MITPEGLAQEARKPGCALRSPHRRSWPFRDAPPVNPPLDAAHRGRCGRRQEAIRGQDFHPPQARHDQPCSVDFEVDLPFPVPTPWN